MDRRRPLDSPRLLEPLGPTRRRQPEAKTEGRPPARLPSLSTPRQTDDGALPPVKRGVAALSPLNAVTPDARPVGMRRHFFDEHQAGKRHGKPFGALERIYRPTGLRRQDPGGCTHGYRQL